MEMVFSEGEEVRRFVLIADDEYINREILGNLIKDVYNVIYAVNGNEALEIIKENKATLSVVLLDLMMPEMDGFEVMEIMHADEELKHIPIIVLTSEKDAEVKSLKMGAADFITKPYGSPEVIRARIERTIELSEDRNFIEATEKDPLTGLYNRAFFYEYAEMMDRYHPDIKTDAVILDVEHFHLVNEIYGRSFGDKVLKIIGDSLQGFLSGTEGLACRNEADTFYLYVAHQDSYEELLTLIQNKLSLLSRQLHIRFRMGVYSRVEHELSMEERFSNARFAGNTLRGNFLRSIAFYDMSLRERSIFLEHLVNDIHQGLEQKQFTVHFQPIYDISGEEPVLSSAEALVRWDHPQYGMIRPRSFLTVFEENGLISMLDHYVLDETVKQLGIWRMTSDLKIPVSVNISRVDLYDPELADYLLEELEKNGLSAKDLMIEITESAYTSDSTQLIDAVERLRTNGFLVEMDDFGAGYSSLNSLATMPVDVLKLDMVFIQRIHEDDKVQRMVGLIMEMAEYIGVPVVAEGVEVAGQYDLLKEMGCRFIQGYYFSKPLPPLEFEDYAKALT
ncbi:MAG: EAL domain-containing protein [Lachnospiraceae bacterium]|nr:EAL domain-containing protein [Lachnospiraceae bacterium]